jgi:hypothetical protein
MTTGELLSGVQSTVKKTSPTELSAIFPAIFTVMKIEVFSPRERDDKIKIVQ